MNDRRDFLHAFGAASVTAAGWTAFPSCAPSVDTGREAQTSVASTEALDRIGVQLYTVRAAMQDDVEATLDRIAEIGYREVEFWKYYDHSPTDIRRMLDARGLTSPAAHVPLEMLESSTDQLVELAQTIGHHYLIVASLDQSDWSTLAALQRTALRFNYIGEALRDAGLMFGYHNHDYVFQPIDNQIPFDILLAECDPDLVTFEMDLFWTIKGGADPIRYFEAHPKRFHCVHVKDMAADGAMVDVGEGDIDFAALFAQRDIAGIRHFFVEHDTPEQPFHSIAASYDYLRGLRF